MIVKIIGIEFFKKTFRWKLKFDTVIHQSDADNDAEDGYESEELDFSKIMERNNDSDEEEDDNVPDSEPINHEKSVNDSNDTTSINSNMINNLAKDDSVSMVNEMSRTENNNLKLDESALEEITSIISQKNEAEHYKINSERAQKHLNHCL